MYESVNILILKLHKIKKNAKSHYLKPIGTMYSSKASCYKNFLILFFNLSTKYQLDE